jgi:hypothetical protein
VKRIKEASAGSGGGEGVLRALAFVAVALGVVGISADLYVLVAHDMSLVHRISDILSLIPLAAAAYKGWEILGTARR